MFKVIISTSNMI